MSLILEEGDGVVRNVQWHSIRPIINHDTRTVSFCNESGFIFAKVTFAEIIEAKSYRHFMIMISIAMNNAIALLALVDKNIHLMRNHDLDGAEYTALQQTVQELLTTR